ncbi:class I SAM-dependent methyltransferase [Streptomyces sp. NPDC045369]|uniref:class I SAM-dependent methyltransferase n=1 Tax=Streptomyces sp. NPDC045369 TaxID=3155732 RepID=UPI0033FE6B66
MSRAPQTPGEYWDAYKPYRGGGAQPRPDVGRFEWTQYAGHGPGAELLGSPGRALDLGPAEGREAACLAGRGVRVTGVDLSAVQTARARAWWQDLPGLDFVHGEACSYLSGTTETYDAIYSVWGAVWFTDPGRLLPLVAARLAPGGVFAFSQAEPAPGAYGPQAVRGKWLEGRERELTVTRWQYPPESWAGHLKWAGFDRVDARILPAPDGEGPGTLLVVAR